MYNNTKTARFCFNVLACPPTTVDCSIWQTELTSHLLRIRHLQFGFWRCFDHNNRLISQFVVPAQVLICHICKREGGQGREHGSHSPQKIRVDHSNNRQTNWSLFLHWVRIFLIVRRLSHPLDFLGAALDQLVEFALLLDKLRYLTAQGLSLT